MIEIEETKKQAAGGARRRPMEAKQDDVARAELTLPGQSQSVCGGANDIQVTDLELEPHLHPEPEPEQEPELAAAADNELLDAELLHALRGLDAVEAQIRDRSAVSSGCAEDARLALEKRLIGPRPAANSVAAASTEALVVALRGEAISNYTADFLLGLDAAVEVIGRSFDARLGELQQRRAVLNRRI